MAVYATAEQMFAHYDERTIRQLLSDTGAEVTGDLTANAKLVALIKAASGRLEAACFVSDVYLAEDLAALAGNSLELAGEIVCQLVMARLMRRRPDRFSAEAIAAAAKEAEDYLQLLRNGQRLFNVEKATEAGKPEVSWPTTVQIQNHNAITQRTRNFYPNPALRLPISRGGG